MAELYAKPYEVIDTGYNPQQTQQGGQDAEMQAYLASLPPEERQAAIERINAPLTGEELALMASSGEKIPTLEEYAEIEKYHKNHEISFIDGLGKIAEGGEQVMTDLSNAFASMLNDPSGTASKMPATAVEAFAQGTRNFYGMLAQSQNPDSVLFRVKDFLSGGGNIEDRYKQYLDALEFNKKSVALAEGKETWVMDKDMINHEVTQAMAYIADPTLFIPFGKVASTGLRAVGLGEKLTMAGARAAAIKNGIIGNTIKWGAGQPLEFMGGAVRNTIDYGLEKAGEAFEATTGISGKEFAQTARMSGVGFSASGVAGYAVPYASTISDAYLVGSSARGFGEALTLLGDTMAKNKFGRGINSWAAEALDQAQKNGIALSPHAKGLLKTLNAVDPLFAYGWNGLEGAAQGAFIGGGLGYLSGGEEGLYSGIGAGIALGGVGATAGKMVADVTGGTNVARRAVQAKMVIEGHKVTNPEKAMFFQAMQKAAEASGKDVDLVNGIIAGIDNVAPNFEFHALTPEQFVIEAAKKGYNPETGKFLERSAIDVEFGTDRASKAKAMYILRSIGGDFVGNRQAFLDALKGASSKDSANIPSNLKKYIDVAKTFDKLTKTQQEAILKEIDGQDAMVKEYGGKTKLREVYDAIGWAEAWTDQLVKKFETDREGARKDIADMLAQETGKDGKLTKKGLALADKLRAEGFLDRDNKLLRERNLLQADLTFSQFAHSKGAVIGREADGKTHMYINLKSMGDETFPHELFHTIMRESPMKKHFTDTLIHKLLGTVDKDGNLVRPAEVNLEQVTKFFKKYIDLTHRNDDGTLNAKASEEKFKQVQEALAEYQNAGENKKISDKARSLIENYTEEFGAYYFSHWLMGRNRNTLFFGGELKGIEGLVERAKDSFKDFWQSKISKSNPEFDFSRGLNEAFDRSKGLGRIGAMDYFMRDMVRAASNANREVFRPDSMTLDNLRDFERSNGLRNLTAQGGTRRLNPREQVTQNIRLGKEAYKILSGLDKNLRTSKDVLDENGKQIITGRLSEAELDALVKGGIVPRAWADKVNQGYAMLDGTVSNIFSAGYLGRTEQTTDASYPRLTGKDVSFKNRKAVLFDVETKIKADGTFYTLFHTLDLAVIEQRGNHLWQNVDYRNLWNGDRAAFEADFFKYISNASKASTDSTKKDSAALLETGDGNGAKRRDVMHQMAGMALQTGDAYKHQPIAVIPEGIRHSVTTFNIDGMTMPRVETGTRYDINMGNAHKFIRENWQPDEMKQEKTPSGVLMTHESGFKFSNINGKTTAYTSTGRKIGTFDNIKSATNAAKSEYKKVYDSLDRDVDREVTRQDQEATKFQPLDEHERNLAFEYGDLFAVPSVKAFVGDRLLLRQTREEHIFQRALEAIEDPEKLYDYTLKAFEKEKVIFDESNRLQNEYEKLLDNYVKQKDSLETVFNRYEESLRSVPMPVEFNRFETWLQTRPEFKGIRKTIEDNGFYSIEGYLSKTDESEYYRQRALYDIERHDVRYKFTKTEDYQNQLKIFEAKREALELTVGKQVDLLREKIQKFREQNKIVLSHEGLQRAFETLNDFSYTSESGGNTSKAEQAKMLASLVKANVNAKDYSGLLEKLFAADYDDKIQTGVPFVAVTTHGTKSVRLMLTRLFEEGKLGTTFTWAESSKLGQFSAGSQKTSGSSDYQTSRRPISLSPEQYKVAVSKIDAFNRELINLYADALIAEQKELYGYEGWFTGVTDIKGNEITLTRDELVERLIQHNRDKLTKGSDELVIKTIGARRMFDGKEAWSFGLEGGNEGLNAGMAEVKDPELVKKINDYNDRLRITREGYGLDNIVTSRMALEGKSLPPPVKMQTRQLIRMDNPYVVVDPRSYEEKNLSSHMKKAIALGHDGIVFKFLADGGDKDTVFAVFSEHIKKNIKVTETSFDPVSLPRGSDESGRKLLGGKDLKLHFQPTDESEAPKKIQGIKLDMTKAYDVFRKEYEESTGQSWTMDKFMQRASNWQFFGDENGFVAVRPQRSGFVKLVGMAGDNKSKLRGIQQIQQMGLPVWGMVSKDIKDIAVKRGMREPNMIERTLLKQALNSAALGDAEILGYTPDNGVRLRYPDIGEVTKYMVGSPEYYQKLRSAFGEQIKNKIGFQPDEPTQGGRVYDKNSKEFRTGFIGKWAEENPERIKGYDLEFIDRGTKYGTHNVRIRLQDNSTVGMTENVGHITADIDPKTKVASLSSNIGVKYRGNKLSYALYSEMAERLRSMGVQKVDGTIVNPDGIPIKVREKIIGNTRILRSDGSSGIPIGYKSGAKIIQARQAESGNTWGGIDVVNELDFNARYQPDEAPLVDAVEMAEARRLGDLFKTKQMREFVGDRKVVPQTADEGFTDFINNFKQADINQQTALYMLDEMARDMFGGLDRQTLKLKYNELIEKTLPAWFKKYPREKEYFERAKLNRGNDYTFNPEKHEVNLFARLMSVEDANEFIRMYRELEKPVAEKQRHSGFTIATAEKFAKKIEEAKKWVKKANPQYNDFSGYLAENLPMREYYQHAVYSKKFKTGEPVVAVGVHGTYTSQGFLKDKKYKLDLRKKDLPLSDGELRGAYFAASDATVLSPEYQGYDPKKLGYEISTDFRRPESDSPNIGKSAIRFDNPLVVDGQQTAVMKRTEKILGEAIAAGHDGVIYINQMDGGGLDVSFILPVETVNRQQRMIGSTREKAMAGDAYEPLPRGEGLTNKTANLQPAEGEQGGRTYTPKQMEREFIGRIAAENPEKIKGLKIAYGIVQGRMGEEAVVLMKDGKNIGRISWMTDKEYPDRPANDISVEIEPSYRGRGLQDVLYSEAYERMRANGTTMTRQDIYNTKGLPVRSQIKILGKNASTFNTGFVDKKLTYAAFMREMKHALASGEEFVSTEGVLDPKAWYQPSESWEKSRELGMKSTWNSLPEASRKLFELNIKKFGLTNSPYEAGYILPDARMLDFSGRSQSSGFKRVKDKYVPTTKFDDFRDYRGLDHREAVMLPEEEKKMKEEYGWEEDKIGKMQQAGAIRIDHSNYGKDDGRTYLDIGSIPTNKQYEAILDIIKNSVINKEKHTLGVDIRVNGRAINHPLHDMSVENPERVILALKREVNKAFKQESNKPKLQPSEYTEFKSEQSPMGRIMRNAKGYVITMANNKFRVYNPAKAIIGVYGSEEEAKKRIYREIPKQ